MEFTPITWFSSLYQRMMLSDKADGSKSLFKDGNAAAGESKESDACFESNRQVRVTLTFSRTWVGWMALIGRRFQWTKMKRRRRRRRRQNIYKRKMCARVYTVSKCFYTEPFLLSFMSMANKMMMTIEWREGERERIFLSFSLPSLRWEWQREREREKKERILSICSTHTIPSRSSVRFSIDRPSSCSIEVHWNKWVARRVRAEEEHLHLL